MIQRMKFAMIEKPTCKMFKQMQSDCSRAKIVQMVHDDSVDEDFANILLWTSIIVLILNPS